MRLGLFKILPLTCLLFACKPGADSAAGVISHVDPVALSTAYVADWSVFDAAAAALRNSDSRYTIQQFTSNFIDGISHSFYSLKHGRVEYAHAAGLTGAGQIISIQDSGFRTSHNEFAGKTIYSPAGFAPGIDEHGTGVASIAAGVSGSGSMIGVAPGAALALGDWATYGDAGLHAANQQAQALGAIVQNNSWGFPAAATAANFNINFKSGGIRETYFNSLKSLSANTVIVFAVGNDQTLTTADLMSGLPMFDNSLQNSWISVINSVPVFSGNNIVSATIFSSSCLEAAAWCMAADGTTTYATDASNSSYAQWTGSSFAAPQVSGGIALLAEAFPSLSSEELRARMLASADNSFYSHSGYVEFATGVQHGFNSQFGHGFMNMKAALSPIGGSYLPRSNGASVPLDSATIASTGMAGNILSRNLASHDLTTFDGLGAGFDLSASLLTADVVHRFDPLGTIEDLFSTPMAGDSFAPQDREYLFAAVSSGQQFDFETDGPAVSLLLPTGDDSSFGVALSQSVDAGAGTFEFGLSAIQENDGFVGIKSLLDGDSMGAVHGGISLAYNAPLGRDQLLTLSGQFGVAGANANLTDMEMSDVRYNALGLTYDAANVFGSDDRLALEVSLPNAIQSGSADVTMPVARAGGGIDFSTLAVPLAATSRQVDISASYGFSLFKGSDVVLSAVRSLNSGNIAGNNTTEAGLGFRFSF